MQETQEWCHFSHFLQLSMVTGGYYTQVAPVACTGAPQLINNELRKRDVPSCRSSDSPLPVSCNLVLQLDARYGKERGMKVMKGSQPDEPACEKGGGREQMGEVVEALNPPPTANNTACHSH